MHKIMPKALSLLLILTPLVTVGHEGHGINGPAHYILSLEHAVPIVLVIWSVVFIVSRKLKKQLNA